MQSLFEDTVPNVVNWKRLWNDFSLWVKEAIERKDTILWSEQQRQIETLMLGQSRELDKSQFILVFSNKGTPDFSADKMTYWEALHTKQNLEGDSNGKGGDEDLDKITIINLNNLMV